MRRGRNGGRKSGEVRRAFRDLKQAAKDITEANGGRGIEVIINAMMNEAANGNVKAAMFIAQLRGDLVQRVEVQALPPINIEEVTGRED